MSPTGYIYLDKINPPNLQIHSLKLGSALRMGSNLEVRKLIFQILIGDLRG